MSGTDRWLSAVRAADAFRACLGLDDWEWTLDLGVGNFHPAPGHRCLFHARSGSSELGRYGIYSLTLVVTLPASVFADIILEGGHVALVVHPDRVSLEVDMEPFAGLVYKSLTESEIDEMAREWKPFRLVSGAVAEADARLKSNTEK